MWKWFSVSFSLVLLQITYCDERTRLTCNAETFIPQHYGSTAVWTLEASKCTAISFMSGLRGGGRKSRVRKPRVGRLKLDHLKRLKPKGDAKDTTRGLSSSKGKDLDHYDHGDGAWQVRLHLFSSSSPAELGQAPKYPLL